MDIVIIFGTITGVCALAGIAYKIGKWTGRIDKSLQELTDQQKLVNLNLSNHIVHYDAELTQLRESIANIQGSLDKIGE